MNYIDGCRVNVDRLSLVQVESRMAKNNGQEEKQKKLEKCRRALFPHHVAFWSRSGYPNFASRRCGVVIFFFNARKREKLKATYYKLEARPPHPRKQPLEQISCACLHGMAHSAQQESIKDQTVICLSIQERLDGPFESLTNQIDARLA